jgi:dynactin complex subunit
LQHKELSAHLSKVSAAYENVKDLQSNAESRTSRLETVKQSQTNLETRANVLLRRLLTINAPQTSEAEDKWFKELARVKGRLDGQRGLLGEARARVAEGKRLLELAGRRGENDDEEGKKKLDSKVIDAIEEAYVPLLSFL